jgi:hypothetical protein
VSIRATADSPGKTVYAGTSEGGVFVVVYIATSPELFTPDGRLDLGGEEVTLTPDEARDLAEVLEHAADEADLEAT